MAGNKHIAWVALLLSSWWLVGCGKELSDQFGAYPNTNPMNDTAWSRLIGSNAQVHGMADSLRTPSFVDSFAAERGDTLVLPYNLEIRILPQSLVTATGQPVQGNVVIEVRRNESKGDWLRMLQGSTSENKALVSDGNFFIRISQQQQELRLAPNSSIILRFSNKDNAPNPQMQVFHGQETFPPLAQGFDTGFTWRRATDTSYINTYQLLGSNSQWKRGYELTLRQLRWVSIARFADTTVARNRIYVILPPNFSIKNTLVFAVADDQKTVLALPADYASRTFSGSLPLNGKFKLVSISRIGPKFFLGQADIVNSSSLATVKITPTETSLRNLLIYLSQF